MSHWRKQAEAIRAQLQKRRGDDQAAARQALQEQSWTQQSAHAKKVIREVLTPVLTDFAAIVTGTPGKPIEHDYDRRAMAVTCDLNSQRFVANVYLLPDAMIRIAVFLVPSQTEPHYRDFAASAAGEEIENWFGSSLVKLYESR
jgi:hypothetical protein